jgi:hypothetical protein
MHNLIGRTVWSGEMKKQISIPSAAFARGIYLIQIVDKQTGTMATYKMSLK